jgi:hypothetical protein
MLKQKKTVILTTQMFMAFRQSKAQSKHIHDVIGLQLALNMTIVPLVHNLQLFRVSQQMTHKKKFK